MRGRDRRTRAASLRVALLAAVLALEPVVFSAAAPDAPAAPASGAGSADAYRRWISDFATGVGGRDALVILEPDALAAMDCLDAARRQERLSLLRGAVEALKKERASVYIDAGNARWQQPAEMARR